MECNQLKDWIVSLVLWIHKCIKVYIIVRTSMQCGSSVYITGIVKGLYVGEHTDHLLMVTINNHDKPEQIVYFQHFFFDEMKERFCVIKPMN